MIRMTFLTRLCLVALALLLTAPATQAAPDTDTSKSKTAAKAKDAKSKDAKDSKSKDAKSKDAKGKDAKSEKKGKPSLLANYGDWGAFLAVSGKDKTCYALASPKERQPSSLKRDQAYVFISSRPAENVRNEISIIMGFAMKDGGEARAEVGSTTFDLIAKGPNAWVKNPAEEGRFIDALKKGGKLVVKASSIKGNATTDTYPLSGFSQALDRVQKECS